MEGLVALLAITLITINLCGVTYLLKNIIKFMCKFIEVKDQLDEIEHN